jgi:hypothetical protein
MTTEKPAGLAAALAQVQSHLPTIGKTETATVQTKTGGSYKYSYADLAAISKAVMPLLGAVGLSWITKPTYNEAGKFVLAYKLLHSSGESEAGEYPLPSSGTPQEIGSAITYARRYCLCSVTGVAPEQDDDDGAAASSSPARVEEWDAAKPANPAQTTVFDQFLAQIKAAEDPNRIGQIGLLVKEARGGERITRMHYDRLTRAAGDRLAKLQQAVPA